MKINYTKIAIAIMLVLCTGLYTQAQTRVRQPRPGGPGSWRLLGTIQARLTADHDVIVVAGPYDYFRRLKFKVTDAPLDIYKMIVTYDDGGRPEIIQTRFTIPQGGESRIIDLRGGRRKLRTVEFWYKTASLFRGRADLTLFGIK